MNKKITERIIKQTGCGDILEILGSKLSMSDMESLLLEVYKKRSGDIDAPELLRKYVDNRFSRPSGIDPLKLMKLVELAYSLLPDGYERIELSPVAPAFTCSALGPVDQNNVMSALRNCEVVSDLTNLLALEAASRKKKTGGKQEVKLASAARMMRTQFWEGEEYVPHFLLYGMISAGYDTGNYQFELRELKNHATFYLDFMNRLPEVDYRVNNIRAVFNTDNESIEDMLRENLIPDLKKRYKNVSIEISEEAELLNYYKDVRFQVYAAGIKLKNLLLADGGFTDWTQRLLSNNKERLMTSGIGLERIPMCF